VSDQRAREMIGRPLDWPAYPKLPLIRRGGDASIEDCGYLWAHGEKLTVYLGNILLAPTGEVEKFATVDALLAKWQID
jgi:hypothetical protein